MKVFCYRNLQRKGVVWSIKSVETGLVVDRKTRVTLTDCHLKVSQAGRKRVLSEKRKNVHAGVQGKRVRVAPEGTWKRVEYNPYLYDSFVFSDTKTPVKFSRYVKLTETGCYVLVEV